MTLNNNLIPEDSPMARNQGQTSAYDFDSQNEAGVISYSKIKNLAVDTAKINNAAITNAKIEDAAITTAKIGTAQITTALIVDLAVTNGKIDNLAVNNAKIATFEFTKGTGGTLTLGGTTNGNGMMIINDASGAAIIKGDNLGHHYYGTSGTELVKIDWVGLHNYNAASQEIIKVDVLGFHAYNTSGSQLVKVDADGLHMYRSTGEEVYKSDDDGFILRNTRAVFFEETTAGQYGDMSVNASNQLIISLPSTNQYFVKNYAGDVNLFTISNDEVFSGRRLSVADGYPLWLGANSSDISSPQNGYMYYNSNSNTIRVYNGGSWYTVQVA